MIININGKEYEARFGIGFVRELDKKYNMQYIAGQKMGYGIEAVIPLVLAGDATALAEVLLAGTVTCKTRPSQDDIDLFIDEMEDYDGFVEAVIEELKKQNATKKKVAELEKNYKAATETKKAEKEQEKEDQKPMKPEPKMPITK